MKNSRLTILGAGAFGSALGQVLLENNHQVIFYDPNYKTANLSNTNTTLARASYTDNLADSLKDTNLLMLAAPSAVVPKLLPSLPHDLPFIIATKGLLGDSLFRDFSDYMVLSGPGFAKDIMDHRDTLLTATDQRIIDLFSHDYLSFDSTPDRNGVLLCGALKNVYAILAGLLNLTPDTAEHTAFLTEVGGEMQALLSANNADPATVNLACGQGDLKITCAYPSRNYEFGQILRENPSAQPEKTVEGVTALKNIKNGAINVPSEVQKLQKLIEMSAKWA